MVLSPCSQLLLLSATALGELVALPGHRRYPLLKLQPASELPTLLLGCSRCAPFLRLGGLRSRELLAGLLELAQKPEALLARLPEVGLRLRAAALGVVVLELHADSIGSCG